MKRVVTAVAELLSMRSLLCMAVLLLIAGNSSWSQPRGPIVVIRPGDVLPTCYMRVFAADVNGIREIRLKPAFGQPDNIVAIVYRGTDSVMVIPKDPKGKDGAIFYPRYGETFPQGTTLLGQMEFVGYHEIWREDLDFFAEFYSPLGQLIAKSPVPVDFTLERIDPCRPADTPTLCRVFQLPVHTGYDPIRAQVLPPGSVDPLWTVISDPNPQTPEPRPADVVRPHRRWSALPSSQWISGKPTARSDRGASWSSRKYYVFQRCFCLAGRTGGTVRLIVDLQVLADNTIDSIVVCGKRITRRNPLPPSEAHFYEPQIFRDTIEVAPGTRECCIRAYVMDAGVVYGLNISGTITAITSGGGPLLTDLVPDSCCAGGWIVGQKFHDLNCNGRIDAGEPPLSGWRITAQGDSITYSTFTDTTGWYYFNVPPGTYVLSEEVRPGFSPSEGGPFHFTLGPAEVVQRNFLNCTAPSPCDTIGIPSLDSACCQFTIPIFLAQGPGIGGITSIQWSLSGGRMESISPLMGCPYTLTPPDPYGTTSGTITFSPACTANPLDLGMEVTPTTASGQVELYLTINHGPNKVCRDTVVLRCARAPITKCDSLAVSVFTFYDLQLSGRTFTIFNLKQPSSPIKQVQIRFNPPPCASSSMPQGDWSGGGLYVDGGPRPWGVGNSGAPKYSLIDMACDGTAPQGAAANNTVQFNLGVDQTCGWRGDVIFTVIHCDGDTCTLTYRDWCAMPPLACNRIIIDTPVTAVVLWRIIRAIEVAIDTNLVPGNACAATIAATTPGWVVLGASVDDRLSAAERESGSYPVWNGEVRLHKSGDAQAGFVSLPCGPKKGSPSAPWILRAFIGGRERSTDTPGVAITFYDDNANPIATREVKATTEVTSVPVEIIQPQGPSSGILRVQPNPATDQVQVDYLLGVDGMVAIEVCDILGRCRALQQLGPLSSGIHSSTLSIADLPAGSYTVRLRTSGGVATAPLQIVR